MVAPALAIRNQHFSTTQHRLDTAWKPITRPIRPARRLIRNPTIHATLPVGLIDAIKLHKCGGDIEFSNRHQPAQV